jgi:hypothetical protein
MLVLNQVSEFETNLAKKMDRVISMESSITNIEAKIKGVSGSSRSYMPFSK